MVPNQMNHQKYTLCTDFFQKEMSLVFVEIIYKKKTKKKQPYTYNMPNRRSVFTHKPEKRKYI